MGTIDKFIFIRTDIATKANKSKDLMLHSMDNTKRVVRQDFDIMVNGVLENANMSEEERRASGLAASRYACMGGAGAVKRHSQLGE